MKTKLVSLIFLLFAFNSFGQEDAEVKQSKWSGSLDFYTGNSFLRDNNLGAVNGNINTLNFSINYYLNKKETIYLSSGVNLISLNADIQNGTNQSVLNNSYIQVPLTISDKYYIMGDKKLYTKVGVGFYGNFLIRSTQVNYSNENNLKFSGVNVGYLIDWGFGYQITDDSSIDFGIRAMNDLNEIKKNNSRQKIENVFLVGIGYTHKFK